MEISRNFIFGSEKFRNFIFVYSIYCTYCNYRKYTVCVNVYCVLVQCNIINLYICTLNILHRQKNSFSEGTLQYTPYLHHYKLLWVTLDDVLHICNSKLPIETEDDDVLLICNSELSWVTKDDVVLLICNSICNLLSNGRWWEYSEFLMINLPWVTASFFLRL